MKKAASRYAYTYIRGQQASQGAQLWRRCESHLFQTWDMFCVAAKIALYQVSRRPRNVCLDGHRYSSRCFTTPKTNLQTAKPPGGQSPNGRANGKRHIDRDRHRVLVIGRSSPDELGAKLHFHFSEEIGLNPLGMSCGSPRSLPRNLLYKNIQPWWDLPDSLRIWRTSGRNILCCQTLPATWVTTTRRLINKARPTRRPHVLVATSLILC